MENYIFNGKLLEIASSNDSDNSLEGVFLISVLNQPDRSNRIIGEEEGEKFHKTIIGFPFVAKLKYTYMKPNDFGGHEMTIVEDSNGNKRAKFNTQPIGSIIDSWIEEMELDEYEDPQKCILVRVKLWASRFPAYCEVFQKLYDNGTLGCSWEISVTKVVKQGIYKLFKEFEFIGLCALGTQKTPAVQASGCLEVAEMEQENEIELANALEMDMANLDINETMVKEEIMAKKKLIDTPVETTESTELAENIVEEVVEEVAEEVAEEIASEEVEAEKTEEVAETEVVEEKNEAKEEVASLTDGDLFSKISKACREVVEEMAEEKGEYAWGYISYWFPEEHTVWFKAEPAPTALDLLLFTYTVEGDEVSVSEPKPVKLAVAITDINEVVAEKDTKIAELAEQISLKDEAVIKAGEKIASLNVQISELNTYKERFEAEEKARIDAEIAEEKEALKSKMLKSKFFTEEEIAEAEIAELVEARDKVAINNLIAERYIASFDVVEEVTEEVAEAEVEVSSITASLESDDLSESESAFMNKVLFRRK